MKNSFKIIGLASLASVVLVAWSLVASSAFANDVSSDSFDKVSTNMRAWNMKQGKLGLGKWMKKNMTEEQKAEMEAKHEEMKAQHDAMKAAVDSNDFAAFQAAVLRRSLGLREAATRHVDPNPRAAGWAGARRRTLRSKQVVLTHKRWARTKRAGRDHGPCLLFLSNLFTCSSDDRV